MCDIVFWKRYSFVKRAKNRLKVLRALEIPLSPSDVTPLTHLGRNIVSRALAELENEGLVECKTPGIKVGKIYVITTIGKTVLSKLESDLAEISERTKKAP